MILWSWIFFPRSKVFERSGHRPSSDGLVPRGRCARSVFFCPRRVRNLYCFKCAICCILRARAVHDLCLIRARSVRDLWIFLRPSHARCFCRSRVRTPDHPARPFYWSQVRFLGQIACYRPVESVAYVTRPHDWRIRLACGKIKPPWGKKLLSHGLWKNKTSMRKKILLSLCQHAKTWLCR